MPLVVGRTLVNCCLSNGVGWEEKKWCVAPVSNTILLQECWVCTNGLFNLLVLLLVLPSIQDRWRLRVKSDPPLRSWKVASS